MDQTAPQPARTEDPEPSQDRPGTVVPSCIAMVLSVVRVLLSYGRHLDEILLDRASHPKFPTLAARFGTHDLRRIAAHIRRGILRAMMLQRHLLARAAQGRDIVPTPPPAPADPEAIEALDMKFRTQSQPRPTRRRPETDPDDPLNFSNLSLRRLEAQVRRRSISRTIADICADLGVTPSGCDGAFWNEIYQTLSEFGGSFEHLFGIQERRREAFQRERDKLPNIWTREWRDQPREAIRQVLGYLIGEPPPRGPPDPLLATAPP
jgi:hypothetical protein